MTVNGALVTLLVFYSFPLVSRAQEPSEHLEQAVETALYSNGWEGQRAKQFAQAGDACAVVLTKLVAGRPLSDQQVAAATDILEASFSNLTWVRVSTDRAPRTTLFVLAAFEATTKDISVRERIRAVRKKIENEMSAKVN